MKIIKKVFFFIRFVHSYQYMIWRVGLLHQIIHWLEYKEIKK